MTRIRGFSLIEMLLAISILGLLVALVLPAVQSARESSRRMFCSSNLRNLGIATVSLESTSRHLPGPTMNAHPASGLYRSDNGLFITMLPFLEQESLYSTFNLSVPTTAIANKTLLRTRPSILKCPSTEDSMSLDSLASRFSGPAIEGLNGLACDYVGNDGCFTRSMQPQFGTVRLRVGEIVREYRMRDVIDGTSQTLLFWESRGDFIFSREIKSSANEGGLVSFSYMIDKNPTHNLQSTTLASYKSYILSWTGFRVGAIDERRGINRSNEAGQPYSAHGDLLPCCMTDGSAMMLSSNIDSEVLMALATSQNGDVAQQ